MHDPVAFGGPALILSGALDPTTPPRGGTDVATHLPRGRHIVLRNTSHLVDEPVWRRCVEPICRAFLERGAADGLDASCADSIERRGFSGVSQRKP